MLTGSSGARRMRKTSCVMVILYWQWMGNLWQTAGMSRRQFKCEIQCGRLKSSLLYSQGKLQVVVTVCRDGRRQDIPVSTVDATNGTRYGNSMAAIWAGASLQIFIFRSFLVIHLRCLVVQDLSPTLSWLWDPPIPGVFISACFLGSPAQVSSIGNY